MKRNEYEKMKTTIVKKIGKIRKMLKEVEETVEELSSPDAVLLKRRVVDLKGYLFVIDNEIRGMGAELLAQLNGIGIDSGVFESIEEANESLRNAIKEIIEINRR